MKATAALGGIRSGLAAENGRSPNALYTNFELVSGLVDPLVQCSARYFWSLSSTETTSKTLESTRYCRLWHSLCLKMPPTEFGRNFLHKPMGESQDLDYFRGGGFQPFSSGIFLRIDR